MDNKFLQKVNKTTTCWIWTGSIRGKQGYGAVRRFGKCIYVHRYSYMLAYGDIPKSIKVLHKCDNKLCVNPDHLFLGTSLDNYWDMVNKGRQVVARGEKSGSAKLSLKQVQELRSDYTSSPKSLRYYAKIYKVHHTTIMDILKGNTWNERKEKT